MSLSRLLTPDNPVFCAFAVHSGILTIKMLAMAGLTARKRISKKVFANPEDATGMKNAVIAVNDPDVERVRRAHQNDVENIPVFLVTAFLYTLTDPEPDLAVNLFRAFTVARVLHTAVYAVCVVPQPARALTFGVGLFTTAYMAVKVIMYFK